MTRGVGRNRDLNKVKMRAKYGAAYVFSRRAARVRNIGTRRGCAALDPCAI